MRHVRPGPCNFYSLKLRALAGFCTDKLFVHGCNFKCSVFRECTRFVNYDVRLGCYWCIIETYFVYLYVAQNKVHVHGTSLFFDYYCYLRIYLICFTTVNFLIFKNFWTCVKTRILLVKNQNDRLNNIVEYLYIFWKIDAKVYYKVLLVSYLRTKVFCMLNYDEYLRVFTIK